MTQRDYAKLAKYLGRGLRIVHDEREQIGYRTAVVAIVRAFRDNDLPYTPEQFLDAIQRWALSNH